MVVYWLSEAVPLPVTALIPVFLFPLFQIMSTKQVSKCYINVRWFDSQKYSVFSNYLLKWKTGHTYGILRQYYRYGCRRRI